MLNRVKTMLFRKSTSVFIVFAATAIASGAMIVSASTTINQLGSDIDGEAADDLSGWSVSLSSDGTILAIGARYNDGNGADSGHVRVYEWNDSTWTQKGADIDGEAADDLSGKSVSLSSDGTILAIGATRNDGNGADSGHVRVYSITTSTPTTTTAPTTTTTTTVGPTTTTTYPTTTTTVVAAPAPDVAPPANPQIAAPSFTG